MSHFLISCLLTAALAAGWTGITWLRSKRKMPIKRAYELGFAHFMRGFLTLFCLASCLFIAVGVMGWIGSKHDKQYPLMAAFGAFCLIVGYFARRLASYWLEWERQRGQSPD
jgi:hypothetical protein